jgi:type VI secretion system secreted protein Hcp
MTKTINSTVVFAMLLGGILLSSGLFVSDAYGAVFAKYDGVDGESADQNHDKWIDVLSIDWGVHKEKAKKNRPAQSVLDNFELTMEFEKSTPKLLEKLNLGEVIPKLEIEQTKAVPDCQPGIPPEDCRTESRVTYIKYELKNVQITSIDVNASGNDESPPSVTIANNFEEIKVTYTEYDSEGNKGGNAETTWKVEKGEK